MGLDHSIILQILYRKSTEREVYSIKWKKEYTEESSLIFFRADDSDYSTKLNKLTSEQYMQRLTLLYSMIWKTN
jgi:hypothetical protein